MAGDYLPIRLDLHDDPAVIQMAAALDIAEDDVVGRLVRTWAWFNTHTEDGHASGVTSAWLDRYTSTPGWSEAMESVGWLKIDSDGGITVPGYDTWNGKSAKKRLKANARKRKQRDGETPQDSTVTPLSRQRPQSGHAASVTQTGLHNSNSTVQDSTKKTDHLRTSWKNKDFQLQILAIAKEHFRGQPFLEDSSAYNAEDRGDLLGIAAMHYSGQITPNWLYSSIDAMKARHASEPVTKVVRYFKGVLADKWPIDAQERFGGFYKALHRTIQGIPDEILHPARSPDRAQA